MSLIPESKRVDIMSFQPLPFDDELEGSNTDDAAEVYNQALADGYFEKPI
jgi:hypothetical protein